MLANTLIKTRQNLNPRFCLDLQALTGGEKGIRTLGGIAPTAVFKTAAIDRSAISPRHLNNDINMPRERLFSNRESLFLTPVGRFS